jgi:hypothetical protein
MLVLPVGKLRGLSQEFGDALERLIWSGAIRIDVDRRIHLTEVFRRVA